MATTTDVDLRALVLDRLDRLLDMTAELGLAVACSSPDPGRLPPVSLALVYYAAGSCCKIVETCQAALPAEGGRGGRRGAGQEAGPQREG
jgi:hypothetical protein